MLALNAKGALSPRAGPHQRYTVQVSRRAETRSRTRRRTPVGWEMVGRRLFPITMSRWGRHMMRRCASRSVGSTSKSPIN